MCIGVTILTLPPTVACFGYIAWCKGAEMSFGRICQQQQLELTVKESATLSAHGANTSTSRNNSRSIALIKGPPDQTLLSYTAGIISLIGTYYTTSLLFPYLETTEAREELKKHSLTDISHPPPRQQQQPPSMSSSMSSTTTTTTTATSQTPQPYKSSSSSPQQSSYSSSSNSSSSYYSNFKLQRQRKVIHQSQISSYRPPSSVMEILIRVTPPLTLRITATTFAFWVSGYIQTYVSCYDMHQ